ncbi:DNA replication complex GINS family protein [Candidatus Pacearchaeota archaeon]|nr:DNA replication complex GINS family protein [Candidatus Pacearchaeota archaeon]
MITYNDIYEAVRKERSEELQQLPKDFLDEVAVYFREKKEFSSKAEDFSEEGIKSKKQLENARTLFKELILRRRKKIFNLILISTETGASKRDFENMLDFEKKMFDEMIKCLDSTEKQVNGFFSNNGGVGNEKQPVVFTEDVSEFIDLNGEMIGPFKKGDKVELQGEIAKILIEDRKADLVL